MKALRARAKNPELDPRRRRKPPLPPIIRVPWGRSASAYRPGLFIYGYLSEYPEAPVSDIYKGLTEEIARINEDRSTYDVKPLRRPNYSTFARYFHWFKILGLVERTGQIAPPRTEWLRDILQPRVFYRLTPAGRTESMAWRDPIAKTHPEVRK
jgi:hypothetical protein